MILNERNVSELMRSELPGAAFRALTALGKLADERGTGAYVVGGLVRDILLGIPTLDLDIVVEERAEDFAQAAAAETDASVKAHTRFGTAILTVPGGFKIDIATARSEVYERPGALPVVTPGTIREDLRRRDFTINSMAIRLNEKRFGELLDYFAGERDLEAKIIRVLHEGSFADDPTRILRGVRFSARLDFSFDEGTEELARRSLKEEGLSTVSGERIANEIVLILKEARPWSPIETLILWGVLEAIHPAWTVPDDTAAVFNEVDDLLSTRELVVDGEVRRWMVLFAALLRSLDAASRSELLDRLNAGRRMRMIARELEAFQSGTLASISGRKEMLRSEVHGALSGYGPEMLLLASCAWTGREASARAALQLSELRHVECAIGGADLAAMGVPEGKAVGEVLNAVLRARLDGEVASEAEERALAERLAGALDEEKKS